MTDKLIVLLSIGYAIAITLIAPIHIWVHSDTRIYFIPYYIFYCIFFICIVYIIDIKYNYWYNTLFMHILVGVLIGYASSVFSELNHGILVRGSTWYSLIFSRCNSFEGVIYSVFLYLIFIPLYKLAIVPGIICFISIYYFRRRIYTFHVVIAFLAVLARLIGINYSRF